MRIVRNAACAVLILAAACATTPPPPLTEEEAVRQRAQAYWDARVKMDVERFYALESPEFRKHVSLAVYAKNYSGEIMYRAAKVGKVDIEGDEAKVEVHLRFVFFAGARGGMASRLMDRWQRVEGQWYHVWPHRRPLGTPPGPAGRFKGQKPVSP